MSVAITKRIAARAGVAAALCIAAGQALAADSVWDHNGSQMLWHAEGDIRTISYLVPRPGLPVAPGTVLFEGRRYGGVLEGIARTFRQDCPPAEYSVAGEILSETHVILYGPAPVRAASGCAITSYSDETANAMLEFTYLGAGSRPIEGGNISGGANLEGVPEEEPEEEYVGEPVGYQSYAILVSGGHQITVHHEINVASHVQPDMVNATLTCRSGASHVLMPEGPVNVCYLEDVSADPAARALVLNVTKYDHDTGSCLPQEFQYSYAGLCN